MLYHGPGLLRHLLKGSRKKHFSKFSRECLDDPDRYIFSSVIKACAGLATERHCSTVHAQVMKYGFESDTIFANALIHAYSRCGSVELSM
ncbi:hypothetical protein GIB67_030519 [Kingdonia uniflora]|uniref:Pentatricopeptide repeat-containing protein n=1 Tax=Kingdonia uniflora TaxID=39325 RepID=A0A7J7LCX5_9MAGN|nr:hypothetical protein GIB67_030519 [Kingdonia uniflora]